MQPPAQRPGGCALSAAQAVRKHGDWEPEGFTLYSSFFRPQMGGLAPIPSRATCTSLHVAACRRAWRRARRGSSAPVGEWVRFASADLSSHPHPHPPAIRVLVYNHRLTSAIWARGEVGRYLGIEVVPRTVR